MEVAYLAGGYLWGVQAFIKTVPGATFTEVDLVGGKTLIIESAYNVR